MNATIKRALSMILVLTTLVSTLGSAVSANGIFDEALPITAPLRSTTINTAELLDEASNSSIITTDTLDLLIRISDFNNFTPIEKNRVRNFVNLALGYYYEDDIALLTKLEDALASLGDYAKYEIQLQQLQYEYGSYTNCRADALKLLSEYLEITNPSALDAYMVTLQRSGYSLFDSMLLVEIADNGVFSLDEAQAIYERFPIRADRDYRVISFKDFALNFSYDRSDSLTALPSSITSSEQILSAAAYTNNTALNQAKALLMQGYDTDIIRSAFSVALLLGCEPAEVIASEHSLSSIDATNEYRYLMPSNYNKVSALVSDKSADLLTTVNQYAASAVGNNTVLTEAQFYAAAQNVRDTVYPVP